MMPNWLLQRAHLTPDRVALRFNQSAWTFRELQDDALRMAGFLTERGVQKSDYCGVLGGNTRETVLAIWALQQIGAVAVMLNVRLSAEERAWQLTDSQARFLLIDPSLFCSLEDVRELGATPLLLTDWEQAEPARGRPFFELNETCSIMYTSGTTGRPKGVIQTYGNHYASATASALNLGLHRDDAWLFALPLFHISGYSVLMKSVLYGMEAHMLEKFDVKKMTHLLHAGEVTMVSVVTVMLAKLLQESTEPFHTRVRCVLLGGGPALLPVLETCRDRGIPVFQSYGMTETASQIVTLAPEDALRKIGSAGKPLFSCGVKIDGDGEGEICVAGPNVTPGYLRRPDETKQALSDGWLRTGDIGRIDEEGFLYVLDRRSDLIISGGENIYPAEVESVLTGHPLIKETGVAGVPDEQWGSVPAAFYVSDAVISEQELTNYCRQKLARFKCPAHFIRVDELPRNASNKLLRRELARRWHDEH